MNIILLIIGLAMILYGADLLTDGGASIAKRLKVSDIVIGLTIVAFGTSAPELAVSVSSALKGSADIAVGNVIGSNLFNTLMIVGATALFAPIVITKNTLHKEIPLCILASLIILVCINDVLLDKDMANVISRAEGILLLCFFVIFIGYTFAIAKNNAGEEEGKSALPWWRAIIYVLAGIAMLIFGGNMLVESAVKIARSLGVSEAVIGLTLVAGGTSLPELATSVVAALKKNPEIAIGNVIGSNLFNIFFILGCASTITPLHVIGITWIDQVALISSAILLWLFGVFYGKRTITRVEGAILFICYIIYIIAMLYMQ